MGIAYFPAIYEDELVYSVLSRLYVHLGLMTYREAAKLYYQVKNTSPSIEFLNNMTVEIREHFLKQCTMEELVEKHTMFPMYMRFYEKERRKTTFEALVKMDSNKNIFPLISNKKTARYLRYCPLCAKEDREKYGETYWHRSHQLYGNSVCSIHHCYLEESTVEISGKITPAFISADSEVAGNGSIRMCDDEEVVKLSNYMTDIFNAPVDFEKEMHIGKYLGNNLDEKYMSESGVQRKLRAFVQDYLQYYCGMDSGYLMDTIQIQKLFNGKRFLMHEICQLALFERLSVGQILNPIIVEEIESLYLRVAQNIGVDCELVKLIGDEISKEQGKCKLSFETKRKNLDKWDKIDQELLPQVKMLIGQLQDIGENRPKKISVAGICKALNLPDKRIDKLPRCKEEIKNHKESQEHYWARELVWAVESIEKSDVRLNWKQIRNLINLRKVNVELALDDLKDMDERVYDIVVSIL